MLLAIIISLVIWGLVFFVIWWGLSQIGIPEPFSTVIRVLVVLGVVVIVIGLLMGSIPPFPFLTSTFAVR